VNHRKFGVGRDLCGSSSPTPLPKQSHLQQAAQGLVQVGLEYLQRRRNRCCFKAGESSAPSVLQPQCPEADPSLPGETAAV